jgi:hypothetical protein
MAKVSRTEFVTVIALVLAISGLSGCGVLGGGGSKNPAPAPMTVVPPMATVRGGETAQFSATISGSSNQTVRWEVSGVAGGNKTVGTVSTKGLYTAPSTLPVPNSVKVQAISERTNLFPHSAQ